MNYCICLYHLQQEEIMCNKREKKSNKISGVLIRLSYRCDSCTSLKKSHIKSIQIHRINNNSSYNPILQTICNEVLSFTTHYFSISLKQ